MSKVFDQKGFLINSEVQNSGKVYPDSILWQERESFIV